MTTEIAIMNKQAVAIAADSAITMGGAKEQKIKRSANKIFALSKYHPVGIMIYGNAEFMEIPWESIIKIYRSRLGKARFNTLQEYSEHFINFFNSRNLLFPEAAQDECFKKSVHSYFRFLKDQIEEEVRGVIGKEKAIDAKAVRKIVSRKIRSHYKIWSGSPVVVSFPQKRLRALMRKYRRIILDAQKWIFEKLPFTPDLSNMLIEIAIDLAIKFPDEISHTNVSGVVIVGFGEREVFPSLQEFLFDGILGNRLKYLRRRIAKIDNKNDGSITPFAQSEMVSTFMEGVDPTYEEAIENDLIKIFNKYTEIIIDAIDDIGQNQKKNYKKKLEKIGIEQFSQYRKRLEKYRNANFIIPIMKVVTMLPKDELASMAESLVNLTSFKRQVSMEEETVGGPIDVAVISKGDGFVWIKRKHYFKPELNHHFFQNYYQEEKSGRKG